MSGRCQDTDLRQESVRQEDVATTAALGDLGADSDARARRSVRREQVTDVESDDLGEAEAGAEGQAVDEVTSVLAAGRTQVRGKTRARTSPRYCCCI